MEQNEQIYEKVDFSIWKDFFKILKPYKINFIKLISLNVLLGILDSGFPLLSKYLFWSNYIISISYLCLYFYGWKIRDYYGI